MNLEQTHTSLELSKKLKDIGFEMEADHYFVMYSSETGGNATYFSVSYEDYKLNEGQYIFPIPSYDILNDLCVRYAKEVFGGKFKGGKYIREYHEGHILCFMQEGEKQVVEEYLWSNSILNPKTNEANM